MKSEPPIAHHCHVLADGTVIPDPGYEGPLTVQGPFRGSVSFSWLPARGTEPDTIIAHRQPVRASATTETEYNPVINFAFFDWSYWHGATNTWIDVARETVLGTDGPAALPNNYYHINAAGSVDPFATTIRTLAFTMLDAPTAFGWKITNLYFFRWKGEPGDPSNYPYGLRNVKEAGVATVRFEIWKRVYTDVAFPGATFTDSFHEYKDYDIDASGGTIGDGVPSAVTFGGFTTAQINSFAQLAITDTWPQVVYGSGNLNVHYWIKAVSFTVA